MFYISASEGTVMNDMPQNEMEDTFYTLVPEQGLCLVGDVIVNLKAVAAIRKIDGKTLVYYTGAAEPIILPARSFDQIREAVFTMDDLDDEDDFTDEDEEE